MIGMRLTSSSRMVATACGAAIVALTAPDRLTTKVSVRSGSRALMTGAELVFLVTPGWNVNVPLTASCSFGAVAVPLAKR